MAINSNSRLPRLVAEVDLRGLPIGPSDAFVLSRIDGSSSELDIASATGLDVEDVGSTLERLAKLGAVRFDMVSDERATSRRPPPRTSQASFLHAIVETDDRGQANHPAAALYDPAELDETVDLAPERRRTILETFYRLDTSSHYELLRVDPSADKKLIKSAYYEVVTIFHPDRYYGKSLGSFKTKLERVFAQVTEAYNVLTRAATRAAYDAYLSSLKKTRDLDQRLSGSSVEAEVEAIRRRIDAEARAALENAVSSAPTVARTTEPVQARSGSETRRASQRPIDPESRRRALARKLAGRTSLSGAEPLPSPPPLPLVTAPAEAREHATLEFKRRYEQRLAQARDTQVKFYLTSADQALSAKDPVSAANALRIAATLVPDNADVAKRLADVQQQAAALLADSYFEQAKYEEREGRLPEAARSYERAAQGKPSAHLFERAAYCLLMAPGDMRLAGEHGKRAVALAPDDPQARITLARIYATAGMKQSAIAEFERAATLAPKDDTIKDWIQRLKRGEA